MAVLMLGVLALYRLIRLAVRHGIRDTSARQRATPSSIADGYG